MQDFHHSLSSDPSSTTSLLNSNSLSQNIDASPILKSYPKALLITSTFFWLWAVLNTLTKTFDLGTVSFLTVMLTSSSLLRGARKNKTLKRERIFLLSLNLARAFCWLELPPLSSGVHNKTRPSSCLKVSSFLSSLFVSVNYGLGYYGAEFTYDRAGFFVVYCGVGAVMWGGNAVVGCWIIR